MGVKTAISITMKNYTLGIDLNTNGLDQRMNSIGYRRVKYLEEDE